MWEQIPLLSGPLSHSVMGNAPQAWRTSLANFHQGAELLGTINLSPVWFQQGRNVGILFTAHPSLTSYRPTGGEWAT